MRERERERERTKNEINLSVEKTFPTKNERINFLSNHQNARKYIFPIQTKLVSTRFI